MGFFAPEGRRSIARGVSPWTAKEPNPSTSANPEGVTELLLGHGVLSPLWGSLAANHSGRRPRSRSFRPRCSTSLFYTSFGLVDCIGAKELPAEGKIMGTVQAQPDGLRALGGRRWGDRYHRPVAPPAGPLPQAAGASTAALGGGPLSRPPSIPTARRPLQSRSPGNHAPAGRRRVYATPRHATIR